jgi:hypothetical protein
VVQFSTDLRNWSPIVTNATSAIGTFDFFDDQPATAAQRFFRAVSAP